MSVTSLIIFFPLYLSIYSSLCPLLQKLQEIKNTIIEKNVYFQKAEHPQDAGVGADDTNTENAGHTPHESTETGHFQFIFILCVQEVVTQFIR